MCNVIRIEHISCFVDKVLQLPVICVKLVLVFVYWIIKKSVKKVVNIAHASARVPLCVVVT